MQAEKAAKALQLKEEKAKKAAAEKAAKAKKAADLKAQKAKAKEAKAPPRKKKRTDTSDEGSDTSAVTESEDETPPRKGKYTPGVPVKGFGGRKVAVPGTRPQTRSRSVSLEKEVVCTTEPEKEKSADDVSYNLHQFLVYIFS